MVTLLLTRSRGERKYGKMTDTDEPPVGFRKEEKVAQGAAELLAQSSVRTTKEERIRSTVKGVLGEEREKLQ